LSVSQIGKKIIIIHKCYWY